MAAPPTDPRRSVPRTDDVLADPRLAAAAGRLGSDLVKAAVRGALEEVRRGTLPADRAVDEALRRVPARASRLQPVINATGVVLHTNLGRAELSAAAVEAIAAAAGYTDLEFDLGTGERATRGAGTLAALRSRLPAGSDALVVNNGAAALLLAVAGLAGGREVVWSRGEMVEIGDGFRLPELVAAAGARIREVGTTNRTRLADYEQALGPHTGCLLKVHPSNFAVHGFTASVGIADLARLGPPVVVDIGSGLFAPDPLLPGEPTFAGALAAGAAAVTASADKLVGGPQAGLVAGAPPVVADLRRHPLARALRADKLALAALEATLAGPESPTWSYLRADPGRLGDRARGLAEAIGPPAAVVESAGAVGGGGAPGTRLPGWAVALPADWAAWLRAGRPPVVGRVHDGRCLLDLRCVPPARDDELAAAVRACAGRAEADAGC